jgi:thiamine-monophosphate kinase
MASRTSIRKVGEFGLIKLIERTLFSPKKQSGLVIGIGDDAAVFETARGKWNVITVDAMAEGIHFDLRYTDFRKLGWKAMASNLSDLAAMGAEPKWALINLTIPDKIKVEDIKELYRGISGCAKKFHIRVIGGNITRAKNDFVISITALGEAEKNKILTRRNAKNGDVIAVTGDLGASHAGLRILQNKLRSGIYGHVVRKHLTPEPRTKWVQLLKKSGVKIHACIDISDGLSSDLKHVCDASKVGAELSLDQLPIHSATKQAAKALNEKDINYALQGGEEYELLMTLAPLQFEKAKKILGKRITAIGRINASLQITVIRNGKRATISAKGFKHF